LERAYDASDAKKIDSSRDCEKPYSASVSAWTRCGKTEDGGG